MQKTILLPIYNGIRARNFFRSGIYPNLVSDPQIRLVIAVPSSKADFYRSEFPEKNVVFEPLDDIGESRFGHILSVIGFNLLHTRTIRFRQWQHYQKYGGIFRFIGKRLLNRIFGPFALPRNIVRWCDRYVPEDANVAALFEKYKPDLLIAPDVVFGVDRIFLRSARRRCVKSVGLFRSWDNITSKGTIQVLPDKLILHTDRMKRQAIQHVGMSASDIIVTGPPEYDYFFMQKNRVRNFYAVLVLIPRGASFSSRRSTIGAHRQP